MISTYPNLYKIFNEDCHNLLKRIPNKSIDLILTDPPYNINKYSTGNIHRKDKSIVNNDIAEWDKIPINPSEYLNDFKRILKPHGNIIIFSGYNQIGDWHSIFNDEFDTFQIFVWHKTNPTPKIYKSGFLNSCEFIIFLWNKNHTWNFTSQKEMHNFFECPICHYPERLNNPFHPTQKPIKLLNHLIKISSNPNDIIFDPFMGVGSTGVSSLLLNRKFIGSELDYIYCLASQIRLDNIINNS